MDQCSLSINIIKSIEDINKIEQLLEIIPNKEYKNKKAFKKKKGNLEDEKQKNLFMYARLQKDKKT